MDQFDVFFSVLGVQWASNVLGIHKEGSKYRIMQVKMQLQDILKRAFGHVA